MKRAEPAFHGACIQKSRAAVERRSLPLRQADSTELAEVLRRDPSAAGRGRLSPLRPLKEAVLRRRSLKRTGSIFACNASFSLYFCFPLKLRTVSSIGRASDS